MRPNKGFAPIVQKFVKWVLSECFTIQVHTYISSEFFKKPNQIQGQWTLRFSSFEIAKFTNFVSRLYTYKYLCYFSFFSFSGNMNYWTLFGLYMTNTTCCYVNFGRKTSIQQVVFQILITPFLRTPIIPLMSTEFWHFPRILTNGCC